MTASWWWLQSDQDAYRLRRHRFVLANRKLYSGFFESRNQALCRCVRFGRNGKSYIVLSRTKQSSATDANLPTSIREQPNELIRVSATLNIREFRHGNRVSRKGSNSLHYYLLFVRGYESGRQSPFDLESSFFLSFQLESEFQVLVSKLLRAKFDCLCALVSFRRARFGRLNFLTGLFALSLPLFLFQLRFSFSWLPRVS